MSKQGILKFVDLKLRHFIQIQVFKCNPREFIYLKTIDLLFTLDIHSSGTLVCEPKLPY